MFVLGMGGCFYYIIMYKFVIYVYGWVYVNVQDYGYIYVYVNIYV